MSDFDLAIPTVLRHEGGLVNNKNDPGGITNFGVSLRWLKTIGSPFHDGDFDHDGVVGPDDIRKMTKEDACRIYRHYWWDKYHYERIDCQLLATKVFDTAVNMGAVWATKILQRAVGVEDDGKLGPATIAAANAAALLDVIPRYQDAQWAHYKSIMEKNPHLAEFAHGWENRAYDRA